MTDAESDAIVRVSLAGTVPPYSVVAECLDPWGIVLDATHVYYANELTDGSIARAPRTGGQMGILATATLPVGIAVDATAVYWTTLGGGVFKLAK